jgi:hypothetical protein
VFAGGSDGLAPVTPTIEALGKDMPDHEALARWTGIIRIWSKKVFNAARPELPVGS